MAEREGAEVEADLLRAVAAAAIEAARRRAGVARKELAERAGVSPARVTQVLSGRQNMELRTLARFGAAIGVRFTVRAVRPSERRKT